MSKESVKLFYEALARDKALQEKSVAIGKKYAGQKLDEAQTNSIYQQELVPLARDAGYEFTLAELQEYGAANEKAGMREVSEEELAAVAGGSCVCVIGGSGKTDSGNCGCMFAGEGGGGCVCVVGGGGR